MAANDWFLQRQADLLGRPVARAVHQESTALGAAFLAALGAKVTDEKRLGAIGSSATRFEPAMEGKLRDQKLAAWRKAVRAVVGFYGS
jgi:glycerol kinase